MPTNSKRKGKRGELEAVKFLKSLGFEDARRTQQYNGDGDSDVVCPDSLPRLSIEVKFGYDRTAFDFESAKFVAALYQADRDADGKPWAILWRPNRCAVWRCTFLSFGRVVTTVYGIGAEPILRMLNETKEL